MIFFFYTSFLRTVLLLTVPTLLNKLDIFKRVGSKFQIDNIDRRGDAEPTGCHCQFFV